MLIAAPNFGSGSSREHAAWAIQDWGIKAVIAPSSGDIFRQNSVNIGLLPIALEPETAEQLLAAALDRPQERISIDLENQTVSALGSNVHFDFEASSKKRLLAGVDPIGAPLNSESKIEAYETRPPTTSALTRVKGDPYSASWIERSPSRRSGIASINGRQRRPRPRHLGNAPSHNVISMVDRAACSGPSRSCSVAP